MLAMNVNNQQHLPFISSTPQPAPHPSNRALIRSPQARQDLQRDIQTKWYYKKVSSIHNGALVRQEYRVTWLEPPIPIGPNYDPQDLLNQLDRADGSVNNRLAIPALPPMGLPPLPCPPFPPCDPSVALGCPPHFSISAPPVQEPPPPYTPVQPTVTTMNQPTQLSFINGIPGGVVNRVPLQGQPLTGNNPIWDNRMPTNGYNVGPAIAGRICSCAQCKGAGQ